MLYDDEYYNEDHGKTEREDFWFDEFYDDMIWDYRDLYEEVARDDEYNEYWP